MASLADVQVKLLWMLRAVDEDEVLFEMSQMDAVLPGQHAAQTSIADSTLAHVTCIVRK